MSKVSNCLKMLYVLHIRKRMKIRELAEMLGVKERMIRCYKDELEKVGVYIQSEAGRYGGYFIEEHRSLLPAINLTDSEEDALMRALEQLESSHNDLVTEDLKGAIDKIKYSQMSKHEEERYIYYFNKSKPNPVYNHTQKYFTLIKEVISRRSKIKIAYQNASRPEVKERVIEPYGFIFYNDFYYCIGFCHVSNGIRKFKLSRIQDITILFDERFSIPETFQLQTMAESQEMGFIKEKVKVKLKISSPHSFFVKESIWCDDQLIEEHEDGTIVFTGTMSGNEPLRKWIRGTGPCVEIMEP